MVTQSIVPSSPYDRLSKFARTVCLDDLAVANVASIIVVIVLTPSGGVFDILLSVARLDDSATAETNADSGRRRHGNRSLRVGVGSSDRRDRRMMRVSGRLCLHLPLTSPARRPTCSSDELVVNHKIVNGR